MADVVKKSAKAIAAVVLIILFMSYLTVMVLELLGVLSYHQNQLIHYLEVVQTLVLELRLQIAGPSQITRSAPEKESRIRLARVIACSTKHRNWTRK